MGQNPRAGWRQQNLMLSRPSIGAVLPALARLPAEVSLVRTTPTPPALQVQQLAELSTGAEQDQNQPSTSSVLVADGIPPIPSKVLEKIRRWEYIDLATLLANDTPDDSSSTVVFNGQVLVVSPSTNPTKKRKIALDIQSWSQAYSMYAAALISADSTTKPESASLLSPHVQCTAAGERPGWQPMASLRQVLQGVGSSKKRKELGRTELTDILPVHGIPAKSSSLLPAAGVRPKRWLKFCLRTPGMPSMEF